MSSAKPTILLVHGAFCTPEFFGDLPSKLNALSYPVLTIQLPTADEIPGATVKSDVAAIHELILPELDQGKEIVIVAHSYGGIPGCASIEGLSVPDRALQGKQGGIRAILFIAAFALPKKGMCSSDTTALDPTFDNSWNRFEVCLIYSSLQIISL
jgi:pimeloyl-ACP methyl ester carboxylesterase